MAVAVAASPAAAQIVNIQGALAKPPVKNGVTGQLEAKIDWRSGNNPLIDLGGAASILVKRGRTLNLAVARGGYGRSQGLALTKKSFEHLRTRITLDCRWRWEVFGQHEYDQFRRLSVRALAGTGPALQLLDTANLTLLAGAAYMFEYEKLDRREGTSDAGNDRIDHRGSFYVTGTQTFTKTASLTETFYVQPRFAEPSDVRIFTEISLTTKLTKHFALSDAFTLAYDHTPPDQIKRLDTQLTVALLVTI